MKKWRWLWVAGLAALAATASMAQEWPTKPIQVIVPFPPGSVDAKARVVTDRVGKILGQPLVIINKPGAGMRIGTEQMIRSAPDGYTIGIAVQASTWTRWLHTSGSPMPSPRHCGAARSRTLRWSLHELRRPARPHPHA